MFNPKKWYKSLSKKQRVLLFSVLFVGIIWLFRSQKNAANSAARMGANQLETRAFGPNRVYKMIMLTDTEFWQQRFDAIAAAGFDTVQLVVPYTETYTGNFDFYVNLAKYATSKGLNIVLKTWVRISNPMLNTEFSQSDLALDPNGNALNKNGFTLSFNSPKWEKVYNWFRQAQKAFQPFQDKGYILAHFPACSDTQEWMYSLDNQGDYSQAENVGSGGLNVTRGISYMNYQKNQLREKLHVIAAIFEGWRNGLDVGSFYYDFHKWAGTFDFEYIAESPNIYFIKNNPLNDNTAKFNGALCYDWKRRKGKYFAAEYTNSPGTVSAQVLADNHAQMITDGCNLLSFAFHSPNANGTGAEFEKAKEVKALLIAAGLWNANVKTPTKTGDYTYNLTSIFDNGHTGIIGDFNNNEQRAVRIA